MRLVPLAFLTTVVACAGDPGVAPPDPAATAIDDYLRSLPYLPTDPPGVAEGDRSEAGREGDYQCVRQNLSETRQFDRIVAYAANSDSLWPGVIRYVDACTVDAPTENACTRFS